MPVDSRADFRKACLLAGFAALLLAMPVEVSAEPSRLAVIWPSGLEDHGVLIESALSAEENLAVVDRSQLDDIAAEFELSSATLPQRGLARLRLLKADGILFVESIQSQADDSKRLAFRLVSVETGAIVAAYVSPAGQPIQASPESAAVVARKFLAPARNLGSENANTIPISILNIRPSGLSPSPEMIRRQQEIAALLGPRLAAEPKVFILERRRLGDLDFEKVFAGEASRKFWTGAWLLDGEVKESNRSLMLSVRLTDKSGERRRETSVALEGADNSAGAVEKIAAWLRETVGGESGANDLPVGDRWDRNAEANAFRNESLWALRNARFEESAEAARAAWILGGQFKTSAFRTLVVAETGLAGGLVYRPRRTEVDRPDYLTHVRHATSLVWNMKTLVESAEERNTIGFLVNGSESARQVLYACWRENAFQDEEVASELSRLRTALRAFIGPMDDAIGEHSPNYHRMSTPVIQWNAQKAMMLGLTCDRPEQAYEQWRVALRADANLAPDPVWMLSQLAPAAIDWSQAFHETAVLEGWKVLGDQLDQSPEPHQRLKGWILRFRLWQNWQRKKKRNPGAYATAEKLPAYSWFAQTDPAEIFAILRSDRGRFLADSDLDYYLVPLFEAARRLPRTDHDGWTTEDGPFFSNFCRDFLDGSESVNPMLTEFLFSIRGSRRRLPNSEITGFRFPREEWVSLAKAFVKYEKRTVKALEPAAQKYASFKEHDVIDRESLLNPVNERENHPLAVMTLEKSLRTGFAPPVGRSNPFIVHGHSLPGGVAHSVRLGFTHDVIERASAGKPEKSTYRLTGIDLERFDLLTGETSSKAFPIPEELSGKLRPVSTFSAHRSYSTAHETLVTAKITYKRSREMGIRLLTLNHASGQSRLHDLGPFDPNPNVSVSREGVAYFRQPGNIVSQLRSGGSGGRVFQGTGDKVFMALHTYDTRTGELRMLVNTSRRPAENFLDDRELFQPYYFGPGPGGRPLLKGYFPLAARQSKSRTTPSTLVWDEDSGDWLPNESCDLKNNDWSGWGDHTSGFVTTRMPSGEYLISTDEGQAPFLGRSDSFPFLLAPSVYAKPPIASYKSTQNVVDHWGPAMLPDRSLYFLLVRKDRDNREVPLLRCWHPQFGRTHYDLVLDLKNPPEVDQSYYSEGSRKDPRNYPYRWKLVVAGNHLALVFFNRVQANYYVIRKESIEEKLKGLHAVRETLSRFETYTNEDVATMGSRQRRDDLVVKAIMTDDAGALAGNLDSGMPFTALLGQPYLYPLHLSALAGKPKCVALLLERGADVNALSSDVPAYVFAIRSENLDCIRQLLNAEGVRIDQSIHALSLPILHEALQTRNDAVFDLVWEHLGRDDLKETLETIETLSRYEGKLSIYEEARERLSAITP